MRNGKALTGWIKDGGKWYFLGQGQREMVLPYAQRRNEDRLAGRWRKALLSDCQRGDEDGLAEARRETVLFYIRRGDEDGLAEARRETVLFYIRRGDEDGLADAEGKEVLFWRKRRPYYFGANGVLDEKKTNDEKKETGAAESGSTVKSTAAKESDENKVVRTKGELVAQYALQFVGNPYVYGGNSLTKGTDCSGFVMLIYRHFGVSLPHYDAAIRTKGKRVASLKEAKAGDIICYYGHVAIYLGDGRIVHASNSRDGIKISERADYRTIAGIRRIFD